MWQNKSQVTSWQSLIHSANMYLPDYCVTLSAASKPDFATEVERSALVTSKKYCGSSCWQQAELEWP